MINNKNSTNKQLYAFIGYPGSGKGTLSKKIKKTLKEFDSITPGDIFRSHINDESLFWKKISNKIKKGQLISDEIVSKIIFEKILDTKNKKIILDGFPRTLGQNQLLLNFSNKKNFDLKIVYLDVKKSNVLNRLSSRLVCIKCSQIYNKMDKNPKTFIKNKFFCNYCGEKLIQRKDDSPEIINFRLNKYKIETLPIIDFYKKSKLKNKLIYVNCNEDINIYFPKIISFFK